MSYFEYFCKNIQTNVSHTSEICESIKGTCYSMCPEDEISLREKENMVHVLEVLGPERKFVKSYSRSAADANMAVPQLLRPYSVLKDTVQYLILDVTRRRDVSTVMLYNFVNDRLRAVRQDITIQRLPPEECIILLEPMIRFYVYYGYRLCECPKTDYDPVLNKKYLLECIKWFLYCCEVIDRSNKDEAIDDLVGTLLGMNLKNKYLLKCDRILMETLYVLCNLDDTSPLFRFLMLPSTMKSAPSLQLAYEIAIANMRGNFVRVSKLLEKLCPLAQCALFVYLPVLQRRALQVLSHAYNSKQLTVRSSVVKRWVGLDSDSDVVAVCTHYGLKAAAEVHFNKGTFKTDVNMMAPKKRHTAKVDNLKIQEIFTYTLTNNDIAIDDFKR